ncbi:MAG: beta-glucuronidase [Eubacteriales bacterium]|nr:beta-glucuronidase [Eubacteriales bacterium]
MLYPKLNDARALIDLSGIWDFKLDDGTGFDSGWIEKPFLNPVKIAVPASYNDQIEGVDFRDHYGWAFYQKELMIPQMLLEQRIVLRFGAVTHQAKVYLNGKLLCEHKGGFLPFEAEINGYVHPGKNLLCVAVDNRVDYSTLPVGNEVGAAFFGADLPDIPSVNMTKQKPHNAPNFDFFNYAGIHRPVKMYTTPWNYIEDIVIVPRITGKDAEVRYTVSCVGEGEAFVKIYDEEGKLTAEASGKEGMLSIPDARLWEPGNAYLYTAHVEFGDDVYEEEFGIRSVEIKGTQFLINGKPFYFKGFGKHEDSEVHGRGMDNAMNVKDLSLMKWLGANSFRTSHYPYAEEMMNLCDRLGIVVIDETPAVGLNFGWNDEGYAKFRTKEHHEQVIRDLIARDKNHPCVVVWSIANEPDTEKQPKAAHDYFKPLYDLAHACDPQNRPVSLVICQNDYTRDITAPEMDIVFANRYYGWYVFGGDLDAAERAMREEMKYWKNLGKPWMITEYGADTVAGIHMATPNMFSEEYQVEYYKRMNKVLDECDFVVGEHTWNFADFATVQGTLRVDGNKKGMFTRQRRPKLAAHYFKERWHSIPDFNYKTAK